MNIIIKNCFRELGYKEIGLRKNFYDITKKKVIQNLEIEMWLGFYTSTEYFKSKSFYSSNVFKVDQKLRLIVLLKF